MIIKNLNVIQSIKKLKIIFIILIFIHTITIKMFCNLFKLGSRFNHTLKYELFDYGEMLKPISNRNVINLLASFVQTEKYAKTGNDCITRYLIILRTFTETNEINEIFRELFHDNQKDIIDMETEIIYGMVRVDYLELSTRNYYLILNSIKN